MLAFAEHRLWMARLEKPAATAAMRAVQGSAASPDNWAVQPVRTRGTPGLVPEMPGGC
jgi:hypothetical protein